MLSDETISETVSTEDAAEPKAQPAPSHVLLLPRNLAALAACAEQKENLRYAVTTVHLKRTGPTSYLAESTNGRIAARVTGESEDGNDFPELPGLKNAPNGATEAIIPVKAWKEAFKLIPRPARVGHKEILGNLACIMSDKESNFGATDLESAPVYYTRHQEGRFPAIENVIPMGEPTYRIAVDPELLCRVLETAKQFTTEESKRVVLEFHKPDNVFCVKCENATQKFTGLVMPLA